MSCLLPAAWFARTRRQLLLVTGHTHTHTHTHNFSLSLPLLVTPTALVRKRVCTHHPRAPICRSLAASSRSFTAWSSVTDSQGAIAYDLGSARSLAVALLAQQGLDPTADPHLVPDEVWNTEHAQQWKEGRKGVLGRLRKEEARRLAACGLAPLPQ